MNPNQSALQQAQGNFQQLAQQQGPPQGAPPQGQPGQPPAGQQPQGQPGQPVQLQQVLQGIGQFLARIGHPLSNAFNQMHGFGPQGSPAMNGIQQGAGKAVANLTQPTGSQQGPGANLGQGAGSAIQNAIGQGGPGGGY